MTSFEFKNLQAGDIIRHKLSPNVIVVTANYGDRVTAVRTYDMTQPDEWELIRQAGIQHVDKLKFQAIPCVKPMTPLVKVKMNQEVVVLTSSSGQYASGFLGRVIKTDLPYQVRNRFVTVECMEVFDPKKFNFDVGGNE